MASQQQSVEKQQLGVSTNTSTQLPLSPTQTPRSASSLNLSSTSLPSPSPPNVVPIPLPTPSPKVAPQALQQLLTRAVTDMQKQAARKHTELKQSCKDTLGTCF